MLSKDVEGAEWCTEPPSFLPFFLPFFFSVPKFHRELGLGISEDLHSGSFLESQTK